MTEVNAHTEVLIAGFGGQGVVLAGKLIASAGLMEGKEVVWAPSYGPEMRGGAVHCTVIVSTHQIGSPEVDLADAVLLMDRASVARFVPRLRPGGLLIVNTSRIDTWPPRDDVEVLALPATEAAAEIGNQVVANVVMLGALLARRPIVAMDSLIEAMRETARGNERLLAINVDALRRGEELAR